MSQCRLFKLAISIDQLFNTLLSGYPDETLSARTYRMAVLEKEPKRRWRFMYKLVNSIFFWQEDHCKHAFQFEVASKDLPEGYIVLRQKTSNNSHEGE